MRAGARQLYVLLPSFLSLAYLRHPRACGSDTTNEGPNTDSVHQPLFNLPSFPLLVSLFVKLLTIFLPLPLLTSLIQKFMHFPPSGAHTTASFVRSPSGVHQALHMARDEMREITHDTWDEEIWGAVGASEHVHPRPILRFLFAQKDHWVADETRDELIRARARGSGEDGEKWKPVMEVDVEEGWVHGFCIKQSVGVAERVGRWVGEIVEEDAKR